MILRFFVMIFVLTGSVLAEDQFEAYAFLYDSTTHECTLYQNGKPLETVLSKSNQRADCEMVFEKSYDLFYLWKLNTLVDVVDKVENSVLLYFQGFSPDDAGLFIHFQKQK